jgi:hypothetical protein
MAEEFEGPVIINGELRIPGPVRPEPAAQFGSHVGVDGDFHVAGNLAVLGQSAAEFPGRVGVGGDLTVGGQLQIPGPVRPEPAAQFGSHVGVEGNLDVLGDIRLLNADCAEDFDIAEDCDEHIAPGVVVVLGPDGSLRHSTSAYDKRVAGVVACAGGLRSAIILDRRSDRSRRVPVALMGKVACNVDADHGSVDVGDPLTTSDTPGHAMKATDPSRAFGAVIGKALGVLRRGRGLVPVLVALQ